MIQILPSTLQFLKKLDKNNNKPWFEANREMYEAARLNFLDFTTALIKDMSKVDPRVAGLEAKKVVFRIYRDVRFSKDKSPYKNNMGATLSKSGKNMQHAGYYLHIQPGNNSFAAAGSYHPEAAALQQIRQEIDYNYSAFKKIITSKAFTQWYDGIDTFDKLKTNPKGYDADNPAIDILKNKSYIVTTVFRDAEVTAPDFLKKAVQAMKAAEPLVSFLNHATGA
ncbi:MAG: DUF2461 domain-containing protein [Chitinophagales bacterium]